MRGGEEGGSGIRSVKIIKRQKEQTFPIGSIHKSSTNFPVFSRVILRLYFSSLRLRRAISLLLHLPSLPPSRPGRNSVRKREGNTSACVARARVCICMCMCVWLLNHSPYKLTFIWTKYQQVSTRVSSSLSLSLPLSLSFYIYYIYIYIYIYSTPHRATRPSCPLLSHSACVYSRE